MRTPIFRVLLLASTGIGLAGFTAPASAQDAPGASAEADDIIVTARKRDETSIAVPVTLTAVGAAELQRRAINNIDGIARLVPTLIVGEGGGTIQGGIIAIRGIAGADNNPLNDQAVSFNVDGVGIGRATVRRMSEVDIQQVEVLKGPQALFFGKNSPGGIISIRSADPTPDFQAKLSVGYELKAREWRTEGYISGPISDALGFRIAGSYSDMQGWSKNIVPRNVAGIFAPGKRAPNKTDWATRGTLKFNNGGPFEARFKFTYSRVSGSGSTANTQFVACPLGFPQAAPDAASGLLRDNCKADDRVSTGDFGPNLASINPIFPADGRSFLRQTQILSSLELNYHLTDTLTLTSVTGYYKSRYRNLGNFTQNFFEGPAVVYPVGTPPAPTTTATVLRQRLASSNNLDLREVSEELRLTSNFDGPGNFMVGGLYQDTRGRLRVSSARSTAVAPVFVNNYLYLQNGMSYSVFGQMMFKIAPTIEISGGARYSYEKKTLPGLFSTQVSTTNAGAVAPGASPSALVAITNPNLVRRVSFNNLSPEATISWRPSTDLTVYGSYKEGFLSGGFSALAPTTGVFYGGTAQGIGANGQPYPVQQVSYDQQTTRGFEGGIKAALFNRTLRVNLSAYNYKTTGLQVGVTTQGVQQELRNAGSVRTKGVEFDANWRTPLEGLSLSGAVSYNKGIYLDYQASCYRGQAGTACFSQTSRVTGQTALLQDLSGQSLVRAPRWSGNAGFNYETLVSGFKLGLSGNVSHSGAYFTDTTNTPGGRQKSYQLFDATIRIGSENDTWEAAVIGRNLTDEYYFVRSSDTPFTGSAPGAIPSQGLLGDTAAYVSRGREIMLRLSYRFGGGN